MEYMKLYQSGMEAFQKEDYATARKSFEELIASGHAFADVLNKLAFLMSMNREFEAAAVHLRKAIEINPRYTEAAVNLVYVLGELGRYDEIAEVQKMMRKIVTAKDKNIDPFVLGKIANLHSELAERYEEINWHGEAVEEYRKAVRIRPGFSDLRTRLAVLLREQGNIEDSIENLTHCLLENPNYLPALIQLGLTYYVMGETDLAKKQWERVLDKDKDNSVVKVYLNMLKKGEAIK